MAWQHFFSGSYWLSQPFMARGAVALAFWFLLVGLFVLGIVLSTIPRKYPQLAARVALERFGNCFLTTGLFGLLLFFFRQSQVFFLAWRVWFLLWLVVFFIWLLPIVVYAVRRIPQIKAEKLERAKREQYLPKRQG